jgi:hypothetical protein
MLAIGVLAAIAAALSAAAAVARRSVIGGLLSAIAMGWTIQAALAGATFLPAFAFGVISLLFVVLGSAVWSALEEDE